MNTTAGAQEIRDSFSLRRTALQRGIAYFTTLRAAQAAAAGIAVQEGATVRPLQAYYGT